MRWIVPVIGLLLSGCIATANTPSRPDPEAAKAAWIEALSAGDPDRVWRMLSDGARAQWPDSQAFDAWCRRRCPDLLVAAVSSTTPVSEGLAFSHGIALIRGDDGWRVLDDSLTGGAGVRDALVRLRSSAAGALSPDVIRALDEAIAAPASALSVSGDTARITSPSGYVIRLKKHAFGWRVDGWNSSQ